MFASDRTRKVNIVCIQRAMSFTGERKCAATATTTEDVLLAASDLTHNDVLLGRGPKNQQFPGTINFRNNVVASRKAEYNGSKNRQMKQQIAREVVDHVLLFLKPPGRFLRPITPEEKYAAGLTDSKKGDFFVVVDIQDALEKAKMSLRQKGNVSMADSVESGDRTSAVMNQSGEVRGPPRKDDAPGYHLMGDLDLMDLSDIANSLDDDNDNDDDLLVSLQALPLPGTAATQGTNSQPEPSEEPKAASVSEATVLAAVKVALGLASSLRITLDRLASAGQLSDERLRRDLSSFGHTLYQELSGLDDNSVYDVLTPINVVSRDQKMPTSLNGCINVSLRDLGFPVSLCVLVTGLMEFSCHRYTEVRDLENDLRLMWERPRQYLFDAPMNGKLRPPKKLYGRRVEMDQLKDVFDRIVGTSGAGEVIFISGRSGTGKTALVEQVSRPLASKNGRLIRVKFDELGQVQPLSVVFTAFDRYCHDIAEEGGPMAEMICSAIQSGLGENVNVLARLLPNLSLLVEAKPVAPEDVGGRAALNRVVMLFKCFVKSISASSHPIVLFFDDVQWADFAALDFLTMLLTADRTGPLLALYCYRDNEVRPGHPLLRQVEQFVSAGINISTIHVGAIDAESTNDMVAHMLHLTPGLSRHLSSMIHSKSGGNSLFTLQFIHSLVDDGLLRFSASQRHWEWDSAAIQTKEISENVVNLLMEKILKSPESTRFALKVAACLGQGFNDITLRLLALGESIEAVVDDGFMFRCDSGYRFAHDNIQEASYSLITENERDPLHLLLGRNLWKEASEYELNSILFVVVEQLHRGAALVVDRAEKVEIARLCLAAGEKASDMFAFLPASIYYLYGCEFLVESDWDCRYAFCHHLFTRCAEAQYVTGSYEGIPSFLEPVLSRSNIIKDRVQPICVITAAYIAMGKNDCYGIALPFLREVGEEVPIEPTRQYSRTQTEKTRAMVRSLSVERFLQMPLMLDTNKLAAMKVLGLLIRHTYRSDQILCSVLICRMVQLTVTDGISDESAISIAGFGVHCIMGAAINTIQLMDEEVHRYAKVSQALADRFGSNHRSFARVLLSVAIVKMFFEPFQALPDLLDRAFEVGMSSGNIEDAFGARQIKTIISPLTGAKLGPRAEEARDFRALLNEYGHATLISMSIPFQAILNLIGGDVDPTKGVKDPTELTGEVIGNQEEFLVKHLVEKEYNSLVTAFYFFRMWLAFIFRRFDIAPEMAKTLHRLMPKPDIMVDSTLYLGLVAVEVCFQGGGEDADAAEGVDWRSIAMQSKEKLDSLAKLCPWNFSHKARLLGAETAYKLDKDSQAAKLAYDEAINLAGEHKFIHEQAIACELAGLFSLDEGRAEDAEEYRTRSITYYGEWGAIAKVADLLSHSE